MQDRVLFELLEYESQLPIDSIASIVADGRQPVAPDHMRIFIEDIVSLWTQGLIRIMVERPSPELQRPAVDVWLTDEEDLLAVFDKLRFNPATHRWEQTPETAPDGIAHLIASADAEEWYSRGS